MAKKYNFTIYEAEDKIVDDGTPETTRRLLNKLAQKDDESRKLVHTHNAQTMDTILAENHINDVCPYCGSKATVGMKPNIIRNGKYANGLQRFRCKQCGKNFNRLTNTFLAQTTFSFDYWVDLVWFELALMSLQRTKLNMEVSKEYVTIPTLLSHRLKLMEATHDLQPNLSGIVEIDECHVREAQKGHLKLVNYLDPKEKREARYSYKPSQFGSRGAEFVTIVCAVDHEKNYYSFVSGFGALRNEVFRNNVVPHIADALWLCSDKNTVYTEYAQDVGLPHYVRPSNFGRMYKECKTDSDKELYYKRGLLDFISNYNNRLTYKQMLEIRKKNHLSIAHVNEFHKDIKHNLEDTRNGINIEYVQNYMDWITYLKNIQKDIGTIPTTREHARYILLDLLKKSSYSVTIREFKARSGIALPRPGRQYTNTLERETQKTRDISGNKDYVMTHEDIGNTFSVRQQLRNIKSIYILKQMGRELKIKGYSKARPGHTWFLIKALESHPDIKEELNRIRSLYPSQFNDRNEVQ